MKETTAKIRPSAGIHVTAAMDDGTQILSENVYPTDTITFDVTLYRGKGTKIHLRFSDLEVEK